MESARGGGGMNRPLFDEQRLAETLHKLESRIRARCESLGLHAVFIPSDRAHDGSPPLSEPSGLIARLLEATPGVVVSSGQDIAGVALTAQRRDERLGAAIILAEAQPDDPESAETKLNRLLPVLRWTIEDCLENVELSGDIDDLADQLTDAYETLDLMYSLGRSMAGLDHPERFISQTCARVRETLQFGYVAIYIPEGAGVGRELAGRTHCDGSTENMANQDQLDRLLALMSKEDSARDLFSGPQTIMRPLRNDVGVVGMIIAGDKLHEAGNVSSYDTKLIDAVSGLLSTFLSNTRLYAELREMVLGVLESLSAAIDAKDPYTRGHAQRVGMLSEQIALAIGLDPAEAERLRIAGLLHDVGKIGVSEAVLQKAGRLTEAEYDEIKLHPEIGYRILKDLSELSDILPAVLHHHERLDGRGYPAGLKEGEIPLSARIVAAADTFDAMSSTRSYRQQMPREEVLAELDRCSGTQLDRRVVDALLSIDLTTFDAMIREAAQEAQQDSKAA